MLGVQLIWEFRAAKTNLDLTRLFPPILMPAGRQLSTTFFPLPLERINLFTHWGSELVNMRIAYLTTGGQPQQSGGKFGSHAIQLRNTYFFADLALFFLSL